MNRLAFFILFIVCSRQLSATEVTDSLLRQLNGKSDTSQVLLMSELCWQFAPGSPDSALMYGKQALELSEQLGYDKGIAQAYNDIGITHYYAGQFSEAIKSYEASLAIRLKLGDKKDIAATYNKLGIACQKLSNYTGALYYNIKALKLFEEIGFDKGVAYGYNNIAIIQDNLGNHEKAIFYHLKGVAIKKKINDENGLAASYANLGNAYRQQKKYPEAISYYIMSLQLLRKTGDPEYLSSTLNNLGMVYTLTGKARQATAYIGESIVIREGNTDKKALVSSYLNMVTAYDSLHDYTQMNRYMQKALDASDGMATIKESAILFKTAAAAFESQGRYKEAARYYTKYTAINDSLLGREVIEKAAEMQTRYETEKKDLELSNTNLKLDNATLEIEQSRTRFFILVIVVIALAAVAMLAYSRHTFKQKALLDAELLRQQELRNKAMIDAEEKERIRIARELHDGIGQYLSAIKMNLSAFEEQTVLDDQEQRTKLTGITGMVDDAVREVRAVSHNMMPSVLLRSGLAAATKDFIDKIAAAGQLKIDLQIIGLKERLEHTTEAVLYRVLQECISNIIKHAQATEVSIQLIRHNDHLNLMIEDNGKGFDTLSVREASGIGLKNIVSRVQYLNGTITFDSFEGNGTTVIIDIPA